MDKLKPVLTHKFWILSCVALVVATVGWYLGTSAQAKQIDERTAVIDGLNPTPGATTPNDDWMTKIGAVKVAQDERVKSAADFLWQHQKDQMKWPSSMQPFVEGKTFNTDLVIQARETYRNQFGREVERLRRIVDPYDWNMQANRWEGATYLDLATLPLTDPATWQSVPPTSKEIWYLQEDVWLLEALLRSVRDLNDGAGAESNIIKAPVKQITEITLRGGDRTAMGGGAMAADGSMSAGVTGMEGMSGEMMMEAMGGSGMGGMGGATAGGVDFNMDEEVGPAGMAMTTDEMGAEGGTEMMASGTDSGAAGMPGLGGMGMGGMGMGGMGGQANALLTEKRYVDDAPELPYKTRAFKLRVLMDHRLIPEFLVELTNSPFPVNIERVHWVEANSDPMYPSSSGPGGAMGGGMGMAEGGGYSGMMSGGGARGGRPGASMMPSRPTASPFGGARGAAPSRSPRGGMRTPGGAMGGAGNPMGSLMRPPLGGARSPMGGMRSPMGMPSGTDGGYAGGMMEGMDYGGSMGGQGGDPYSQAMADAFLADVVIGGVMTIYRSPEDVETTVAEVEAGGEVEPAMMPAVTPPPAAETMPPGTDPAAGAAVPGGTEAAVEGSAPADTAPSGTAPAGAAPAGAAPAGAAGTPPAAPAGAAPAPAAFDATAPPDAAASPPDATPPDAGVPPSETPAADPVNGPPG